MVATLTTLYCLEPGVYLRPGVYQKFNGKERCAVSA